jgi:hypothetical protein
MTRRALDKLAYISRLKEAGLDDVQAERMRIDSTGRWTRKTRARSPL